MMTDSETYISIRGLVSSGFSQEDARYVFDEFIGFFEQNRLLKADPRPRGALAYADFTSEGEAFFNFVIRAYRRKLYQTKYVQKSRRKWLIQQLASFANT